MRDISVTLNDVRGSRNAVITRAEAAAALGVDPRTITASIENGTIPSVRLGRRVVIPREKFLRIFDSDDAPYTAPTPTRGDRATGTDSAPRADRPADCQMRDVN
jgi:excisionase family DNA binding protein